MIFAAATRMLRPTSREPVEAESGRVMVPGAESRIAASKLILLAAGHAAIRSAPANAPSASTTATGTEPPTLNQPGGDRAYVFVTRGHRPVARRAGKHLAEESKLRYLSKMVNNASTPDAGGRGAPGGAPDVPTRTVSVDDRKLIGSVTALRLSDGTTLNVRRFASVGVGDRIRISLGGTEIYAKRDRQWIPLEPSWSKEQIVSIGRDSLPLEFKEVQTEEELRGFDNLRRFHYRGRGGAGRSVPIIAVSKHWDLPPVLGFIEISSSMIANAARKNFFDYPYFEDAEVSWKSWDTSASRRLSNIIARISRFVIHPELRGLGLSRHFLCAAKEYASERWHYGGRRPRFLEITAEMLRYYNFVGPDFASMGSTQGNEHRLAKDMMYLVKKALAGGDGMPQGGGGIMTLQRGYAARLIRYLNGSDATLTDVVRLLQNEPSLLDQDMWEALHVLNRRPKFSYIAGLTPKTVDYVQRRSLTTPPTPRRRPSEHRVTHWVLQDLHVHTSAQIAQTSEARVLQDAFGFVGRNASVTIVQGLAFDLHAGELTLVCGGSGSGKTALLKACEILLSDAPAHTRNDASVSVSGSVSSTARVVTPPELPLEQTPLDMKGRAPLESFLDVAAKCGLAEPQLFVRPISSLSSGQRYRLGIALAFLAEPQILIIDNFCEPLDKYTTAAVVRGLKKLARERAVAVLAATAAYDRRVVSDEADHTIMLRRGASPRTP